MRFNPYLWRHKLGDAFCSLVAFWLAEHELQSASFIFMLSAYVKFVRPGVPRALEQAQGLAWHEPLAAGWICPMQACCSS